MRRRRREHEHHRVGLEDEGAETLPPRLAARDAVAVDGRLDAAQLQRGGELVGELQVVAE
jgi:hypothetical protein